MSADIIKSTLRCPADELLDELLKLGATEQWVNDARDATHYLDRHRLYDGKAGTFVRRYQGAVVDAVADQKAIEVLATCEHLSISKWLVQLCHNGQWFTAYFAQPPSGNVIGLCDDKETALRVVIARAMGFASLDAPHE